MAKYWTNHLHIRSKWFLTIWITTTSKMRKIATKAKCKGTTVKVLGTRLNSFVVTFFHEGRSSNPFIAILYLLNSPILGLFLLFSSFQQLASNTFSETSLSILDRGCDRSVNSAPTTAQPEATWQKYKQNGFFKKIGPTPASFSFIFVFSNTHHYNFYNK